jgi:glycosyltransferase involved in cell wall biosynthesis
MVDHALAGPAVSIGLPVYNAEPFLEEALHSLLQQTFQDFELIISDNASTDGTAAICLHHAQRDPRIRYVRQAQNLGAMGNFCYVLEQARGHWFMWAAGDDFWGPQWLERLHDCVARGRSQAAVGQVLHVDEASRAIDHVATGRLFDYQGRRWVRRLKFFAEFEGTGKANVFYALFDRRLLTRLPIVDYTHDYHLIFAFLGLSGVAGIPGVYLHKRIHGDAASVRTIRHRSTLHKVLLRAVLPVDTDFLKGYFRDAGVLERCLLAAALPWKYLNAYPHMVQRLWSALRRP